MNKMPARIKLVRERLVMAKMVLRVVQLLCAEYMETAAFGSHADDAVLLCAIFIGQAEGRPMTAAKLADYAGMPRATVVRKLRDYVKRGIVDLDADCRATLPEHRLNDSSIISMIEAATKAVHNTSSELSKMDRKGIAPDEAR